MERMKTRILLVALAALLLLLAGAYGYRRARGGGSQAAAEDCADKPKPKSEFAMVAECEGGEAPAGGAAPAAPTPTTPK